MEQNINLCIEELNKNTIRSFEKITPLPATHEFYRSRIYTSKVNLNPLIAACDPLFSLVAILNITEHPDDSNNFLQDLAHEIRSFEHSAQLANYPARIIADARYALCSLLDETIAATTWGQTNRWHEKNLLSIFCNENNGNVRFFDIIEQALDNIADNLHLLELLYLCLNFGFSGKYKEITNGQNELLGLTNKLYQIIGQYNADSPKNFLISDEKPKPHHKQLPVITADSMVAAISPQKLFWLAAVIAIALSSLIYFGINLKLNHMVKPIYVTLEQLKIRVGDSP